MVENINVVVIGGICLIVTNQMMFSKLEEKGEEARN